MEEWTGWMTGKPVIWKSKGLKCVLVELNEQRNVNREADVPLVITHTLNYSFYPRNFFHILWGLTNTWLWEWYLYIKYCDILHVLMVKKKNNEFILIILIYLMFCSSNLIFPNLYIPRVLCSQFPMFQRLNVPPSCIPKTLCFQVPMFPVY